jgi:hypothetical protein
LILVDTNVLVDVVTDDPLCADWPHRQLTLAAVRDDLAINDIASGTRRDDPQASLVGEAVGVCAALPCAGTQGTPRRKSLPPCR